MRKRTEEQKKKICAPPPRKLPAVMPNRFDVRRRLAHRTRDYPNIDRDSCR